MRRLPPTFRKTIASTICVLTVEVSRTCCRVSTLMPTVCNALVGGNLDVSTPNRAGSVMDEETGKGRTESMQLQYLSSR
jgi:hypothetical protein